jgi:putative flippase GtrA
VRAFLRSRAARPLRFACTGGLAALVQLGMLDALTEWRWTPILANAVALLLSTQLNFVLSYLFTWGDRRPRTGRPVVVLGRWAAYQGSVAGTALLNMGVFVVARADLHTLVASALGTAVAAAANFVAGDRLVFRARGVTAPGRGGHELREPIA